mmetsp:Transcript_101120/g.182506  ORF Transcript_101120/g.182506 Transcript_101120/m.182506 type:complete len:242 (+) Transcript_101120:68-793(+)
MSTEVAARPRRTLRVRSWPAPVRAVAAGLGLLCCWRELGAGSKELAGIRSQQAFFGPFLGNDPEELRREREAMARPAPPLAEGEEEPEGYEYVEYDWKEEALKKQLERVEARKNKAKGNITPEDKRKRLLKKAMWASAQRKGLNDGVGAVCATGVEVDLTVTLRKPLGINFIEKEDDEIPGRAYIGAIQEGSMAESLEELETGDWLMAVNGIPVADMAFDKSLKYIVDAQGDIKLKFGRVL